MNVNTRKTAMTTTISMDSTLVATGYVETEGDELYYIVYTGFK